MICPFCKEMIQDGAIKCKHCGSMLVEVSRSGGGMESWQAWLLALALFVVLIVLGAIHGALPFVVVISSTIWASFDAASIRAKEYSSSASPVTILVAGLLLWIVAIPWYIYLRSNILAGNRQKFVPVAIRQQDSQQGSECVRDDL